MDSGVIAKVETEQPLEDYQETVPLNEEQPFEEVRQSIEVRSEIELDNNRIAQVGRAAIEDLRENDVSQIQEDGSITTGTKIEKYTKFTNFVYVPGSFLAVENGSGDFLFDVLNTRTDHQIARVDINLNQYANAHEEALIWKLGFKDRGGHAENGVVYGEDIIQDTEVGEILGASDKNQLGLVYNFESQKIKPFVTESSYVEVYQPSNFDTKDFIQFIESDILPFIRKR